MPELEIYDPMSIDFAALDAPEDAEHDDADVTNPFATDDELSQQEAAQEASDDDEDDSEEWEEEPDDTEPPSLNELLEQADDDAVFTFATTRGEVTIPKHRIAELAEKEQEIEEEHAITRNAALEARQVMADLKRNQAESMSETRRRVAALKQILSDRSLDVTERGRYSLQLENEETKLNIIKADGDRAEREWLAIQEEDKARRVEHTNKTLLPKYGNNWRTGAQNLYAWVISQGVDGDDIGRALSPELAEIFIKARQFDQLDSKRKAKVKAAVAPKSKPAKSKTSQRGSDNSTKQKAMAKLSKAGSIDASMIDAFLALD